MRTIRPKDTVTIELWNLGSVRIENTSAEDWVLEDNVANVAMWELVKRHRQEFEELVIGRRKVAAIVVEPPGLRVIVVDHAEIEL